MPRAYTKLGTDLERQPTKDEAPGVRPFAVEGRPELAALEGGRRDHFVVRDGRCFAGIHLIIDLWGATRLDEADHVRAALIEATAVAGATLLHVHVHRFTPSGGLSGVAVLAESHISIHTWPEHGYAAIDVFMCGQTEPHKSIDVLRRAFEAETIEVDELRRGKLE